MRLGSGLLGRAGMRHLSAQKQLWWKRAALADRHKSTEIEAHEASVTCDHDPLRLAIYIDQAGRGVRLKRGNGLLLLRSQGSDCFDLFHQRADHGTYIVIKDRREIGVSVAG